MHVQSSKATFIYVFSWGSVSDSNVLTADIKARLKQVQDDYGVVVIVHEHQITVGTTGLITKERMKSIKDALHKVVGMDFKVSFLTD